MDVGEPVVASASAGVPWTSPSSSKPTGGALGLTACDVKEREGVRTMTGGVSMLAHQVLHSCSRMMSLQSSLAKASGVHDLASS